MTAKVLIIDDDEVFSELVEIKLKSILEGIETHKCENLTNAEEFLSSNTDVFFDLVVIDQHLPDGTGSDFIKKGFFKEAAVLSMSSDDAPDIPAKSITAGAHYFLQKNDLTASLFEPLVLGLIERSKLVASLNIARQKLTELETVKTMTATLRHEINNPLAAIVGSIFILKKNAHTPEEQKAIELLETSSSRITDVLAQLEEAEEIETEEKAQNILYKVPGDPDWER